MTRLTRRHRGHGGFTLLEMLVVVLIISIVIVGAILSLGATGRDSQLEQERDRMTALIAYVRDRGALMTTEYGIVCGQHGYRFVYYDNRTMQWLPETLDDTLRLRHLPQGLALQLAIEGRPIVLDDNALAFNPDLTLDSAAASSPTSTLAPPASTTLGAPPDLNAKVANNAPQIMLLSNGDTNSFVLTIARNSANRSVTVQSNADGTISAGNLLEAQP